MRKQTIPRRTFLGTVAASAAGAAFGAAATPGLLNAAVARARGLAAPAVPTAGIKLGVASYSLREFPLDKALEMIKALKTPYVNFKSVHIPYDKTPAELDALRKSIEAQGFTIVGGGTITFDKDTDADVERYFTYAKATGMPTMVSTCTPSASAS